MVQPNPRWCQTPRKGDYEMGKGQNLNTRIVCLLFSQIEEALVRRKKMELLQRYASDTLQSQSEDVKKILGVD